MQIENGEFSGVDLICTKDKDDTTNFLIEQIKRIKAAFNPSSVPTITMDDLKKEIALHMKDPTFVEYLRMRSIEKMSDAKAMKDIMDPKLGWNEDFISPCQSKTSKSTMLDRVIFRDESIEEAAVRNLRNLRAHAKRKDHPASAAMNNLLASSCALCRKSIDPLSKSNVSKIHFQA